MWETTKLQPRVPLRVRSHGFRQQRSQPPLQRCMATLCAHSSHTNMHHVKGLLSKYGVSCKSLAPWRTNAQRRQVHSEERPTICKLVVLKFRLQFVRDLKEWSCLLENLRSDLIPGVRKQIKHCKLNFDGLDKGIELFKCWYTHS